MATYAKESNSTSSSTKPTAVLKLGGLLTKAGYLSMADLQWALDTAKRKDLPLGAVLVKENLVAQRDLSHALFLQSMVIKKTLSAPLAIKALTLCKQKPSLTAEEALVLVGHQPSGEESTDPGLLLCKAGLINAALLGTLKAGVNSSGQLILRGVCNYWILDEALKASFYIKKHSLCSTDAAAALARLNQTDRSVGAILVKSGELQKRNFRVFLGEIFHESRIMNELELLDAVETSARKEVMLGKELLSRGLITQAQLDAALQLQELVMTEVISLPQAGNLLRDICRRAVTLTTALRDSGVLSETPAQVAVVLEILQAAGVVSSKGIEESRSSWISQFGLLAALIATGKVSRNLLLSAVKFESEIRAGSMVKEQAIILMSICERLNCSAEEALIELNSAGTTLANSEEPAPEQTAPTREVAKETVDQRRDAIKKTKIRAVIMHIVVPICMCATLWVILNYTMPEPLQSYVPLIVMICLLSSQAHGVSGAIKRIASQEESDAHRIKVVLKRAARN